MNAKDFACLQKRAEPHKRFAYHNSHIPDCIGMHVELLGRFALLACRIGGGNTWQKFCQELIIGDVISPNPAGWVEVTDEDVLEAVTQGRLSSKEIIYLQERPVRPQQVVHE